MIKKSAHFLAATLLALSAPSLTAEPRTWTSADGAQTFEGELVGVTNGKITVKKEDGTVLSFPLTVVSAADQKFVEENKGKIDPAAAAAATAASVIPSELQRVMARGTASSGAKYYILYFAAST